MDFRFYKSKITHNNMPGSSEGCLEWASVTYNNGYPYMKIDVDGSAIRPLIGVHRFST